MEKNKVVIIEYDAMVQALAKKFNAEPDAIETIPEVIQIKNRCDEIDEHINFLIKSSAVDEMTSAERTLNNLEESIKKMYSSYIVSKLSYEPKLKLLEFVYGAGGVFKKVMIKNSCLTNSWKLVSVELVTVGVEPLADEEMNLAIQVVYLLNKGQVEL